MRKIKVIIMSIFNKIATTFIKLSFFKERREIKQLKNIHKDERCFIIGNGPSLSTNDLDLIKEEISFSCNMIYELLDKTNWKPYYYFSHDPGYLRRILGQIKKVPAKKKFIGYYHETATRVYNDYRKEVADYPCYR